MVVVADASVAIRGDLSGFRRDLKGAEKETQTLGQRLQSALSPKNVVAGAGLVGIGLGVRNLIGYAGDAADAFAELQQTQRTTDEVFGDSAAVIEDWAERSAVAAGMSQRTVFQSASVMGQTLINMGFSAEEAAEKVVLLQQRASEMAIAFGQTPERAILAITAAMRGERDTIEKFGVSIKQVDVNARVAALGLDTSTSAAKRNAEAMAILDLVLEQTAAQSGRFAESQDDVAVQMAQAKARIDDFMATDVGAAVASIQLGAFKTADAVAGYFDTAAGNLEEVGLFIGSQRVQILDLAEKFDTDFNTLRDRIAAAMDITGLSASQIILELEGAESFEAGMQAVSDAAAETGVVIQKNVEGIPTTIRNTLSKTVAASAELAAIPIDEIKARWEDTRRAAFQTVVEQAKGILDAQDQVKVAFAVLTQLQVEEQTRAQRIAYLQGVLSSEHLADGLEDGRPGVRSAAEAIQAEVIAELATLGVDAYGWGNNVGTSISAGLIDSVGAVKNAAGQVAAAAEGQLRIQSEPPDADSPLSGITTWGGNIVATIAEGMSAESQMAQAAASKVAAAVAGQFQNIGGADPHAAQFWQPLHGWASMGSLTNPSPTVDSGGIIPQGNTYNVMVETLPQYPTLKEIGGELRRLGEMGQLPGSRP